MFSWNGTNIAKATKGTINGDDSWTSSGVSIDTRTIKTGDLFIAIKGINFDGHDFINEAKSSGACAVIVNRHVEIDVPQFIVDDTLVALQEMATYVRDSCEAKVVAITGSNGKTTTKNMTKLILSSKFKTYCTEGNFNNHIGLPMTILKMPIDTEIAIFEMGTNRFGDLKLLSSIAKPDIALITNIGHAHFEAFSTLEGTSMAKAEICIGLKKNGMVLVNKDLCIYDTLVKDIRHYNYEIKISTFGYDDNADIKIVGDDNNIISVNTLNNIQKYEFPFSDLHLVYNSLAAVSIAHSLGQDIYDFSDFELDSGRGNLIPSVYKGKTVTVIDDTYNASPESVKVGIQSLANLKITARKVVLLGNMEELGPQSEEFHKELSVHLADDIDIVHTVGDRMIHLHNTLPEETKGFHFDNSDEATKMIDKLILDKDIILIKGSNSTKMKKIVTELCYGTDKHE